MPVYNIKNSTSTEYDAPILTWSNTISSNNKYTYNFDINLPTLDNFNLTPTKIPLNFSDDRLFNKSKIVSSDNSQKTINNSNISEHKFGNLLPHQANIHLANPWKQPNN